MTLIYNFSVKLSIKSMNLNDILSLFLFINLMTLHMVKKKISNIDPLNKKRMS